MTRTARIYILLSFTALSGAAWALEAGAAKVEITPPLGSPLNGYLDRAGRGATSIHDPLWVRCVYLDDGTTKVFLVNADLFCINHELRGRILELAPPEVPPENIILTATHTYSGAGGMCRSVLLRFMAGPLKPDLLEETAGHFVEAMRAAYAARRRAAIGYGVATQKVLAKNRAIAGGPVDTQIAAIRIEDVDGNPIAVIGSFAAHPDTVGKEERYAISADYAGYVCDHIEKLASAGCVALFLNGALGDQECGNPENKQGWELTESIGRLVAIEVKAVANRITCGELPLHVGYAEPELPPSLLDGLLGRKTIVQTLEIGDLLIAFFPGEPCVELGLGLRERALARGYGAQISVGLANDYRFYFVPGPYYGKPFYETALSFYGPRIDQWFYREFSKLMGRGKPDEEPERPAAPAPKMEAGAQCVTLEGPPYERGFQRGAAFAKALQEAYARSVAAPAENGALAPQTGFWKMAPSFINESTYAIPRLAAGARILLNGMSNEVLDEIEGMADGAGMPFDALWLVQCMPTYAAQQNVEVLYRTPFCTMFAAVGERAGADDLLVGRNFDWPEKESPVIIDVRPAQGRRFVQIGFAWNEGVFTGMNDAGLVLCAERMTPQGAPPPDVLPIEFTLRELLQTCGTLEETLGLLQGRGGLRGYHVLVADPAAPEACVVEFGAAVTVRRTRNGLLLGAEPESQWVDEDARIRYRRLAGLLEGERIIGGLDIERVLQDTQPDQGLRARILNNWTRHSVVFEPKAGRLRVAFPSEEGALGPFTEVPLNAEAHHG